MNAKELFLKDIHFTKKKAILSLVFEPLAFLTLAGLCLFICLRWHVINVWSIICLVCTVFTLIYGPIHIDFAIRYLVREKKQEQYAKAKQEASFMEQKDAQDEKGE